MTESDLVTVSVLTYNRAPELAFTLRRVLEGCGDAPVLVVDNGSTDGTPEMLRAFAPRVRHVRLSENRGAAGRNVGVLLAPTPYVALCDDDTWWTPGSLAPAAEALDDHAGLAVVTARVLIWPEGREDPTCAQMARSPLRPTPDLPGSPILGFLAGASMVRRSAFLEAGGFEPRFFLGGEERLLAVDLAARGWLLAYLPDAVVFHRPSSARDAAGRRVLAARNALWFDWLRLSFRAALRETGRLLREAPRDPAVWRGALLALAGAPWVARARRVIPDELERELRLVMV